ncbi:hypothetical protein JIN85_20135, partial [Luteolibacter pohnpeiensis]
TGGGAEASGEGTIRIDTSKVTERVAANTQLEESLRRTESAADDTERKLSELEQALDEMGEASEESGDKLDRLVSLQRAQLAAEIGNGISRIADVVKSASTSLQEADPKISKTLGNISSGLDSVGNAVSTAAQGFAVGGPFGAAVGGLVGLLTGPLNHAFESMTQDLQKAGEKEKLAKESLLAYTRALEERRTTLANQRLEEFYGREEKAIKSANDELRRQNELLTARRNAEAAEQHAASVAALDNGANRGAVASVDAISELRRRIEAIEQKANLAQAQANLKDEDASHKEGKVKLLEERGMSSGDEIDQARKEAEAARESADSAAKNAELTRQIGEQQIREALAQFSEAKSRVTDEGQKEMVEAARQLIEAVENGTKEMTAVQQQALQRIRDAFRGGIDAQEQAQMAQDIETVAGPLQEQSESQHKALEIFRSVLAKNQVTAQDASLLVGQIDALSDQQAQITASQKEAVERTKQSLSDNNLNNDEMVKLTADTQLIASTLGTRIEGLTGITRTMLETLRVFESTLEQLKSEADAQRIRANHIQGID